MSSMVPTQEQMAIWAAEQAWDWHVRMLFAVVCACAIAAVIVIYLIWGRGDAEPADGRARRYIGRIAVVMFVLAVFGGSFFRDVVSTLMLVATGVIASLIALNQPGEPGESANQIESGQGDGGANEQPAR